MNKEDKELLIKDISSRFPYGVILDIDTTNWRAPQGHINVKIEGFGILFDDTSLIINGSYYGDEYKPYLRPLSSMTEEEMEELLNIDKKRGIYSSRHLTWHIDGEIIDYLNKKMFDWRGLIPMGLALEASEGMYKI